MSFAQVIQVIEQPEGQLWDFAGADGLGVAIATFSSRVSHLAPFQSLTAHLHGQECAVLRLCEHNFRVRTAAELAIAPGDRLWLRPCPGAVLGVPAAAGLARLAEIATTKPRYRLRPFPCDRAVPARIDGLALVAWHHRWQGQPTLLIQTAAADAARIQAALALG